jgi:hypothetical protein
MSLFSVFFVQLLNFGNFKDARELKQNHQYFALQDEKKGISDGPVDVSIK